MGNLHFLDLVIGLVFIYFLLSLICVSLQELKSTWKKERSQNLKKWITDTFNDKSANGDLGDKLWKNFIIDGLTQEGREASYIPKEVFISALLDEIYYGSDDSNPGKCIENKNQIETYEKKVFKDPYDFHSLWEAINNPAVCLPLPFQRVIRQAYSESHQNLETFRVRLERWFEMAMERNSGTYKKKANQFTFYFAIAVTLCLNVDTIKLADFLYSNPEIATQLANTAEQSMLEFKEKVDSAKTDPVIVKNLEDIGTNIDKLNSLKLPIGWSHVDYSVFQESGLKIFAAVISTIVGWIITIFAVSLGAPFWFDTLNKLVNLRAAGKIPNGSSHLSPETSSKDTQPAVG